MAGNAPDGRRMQPGNFKPLEKSTLERISFKQNRASFITVRFEDVIIVILFRLF